MTTTVMKLGTIVICGEALQTIPVWMTFIQGHGHRGWLKILKNSNIDINFLSRYDPYSHETLHKGTLWLGLSCHASFFDLHPRSQLQELMEDLEKHWLFLRHCHHYSQNSLHSCTVSSKRNATRPLKRKEDCNATKCCYHWQCAIWTKCMTYDVIRVSTSVSWRNNQSN